MIYFYDGSKEAFLTALVLTYSDEEAYLTSGSAQLAVGQETVFVKTDFERAARARDRLLSFDRDCMLDLDKLLRSGKPDKDNVALAYFRVLAAKRRPVREMYAVDAVRVAQERMRQIDVELDRMRGFLRFIESASGALYAPIGPDNDIVDLLLPHFRARLPEFAFVIHDVKRKKAVVYDGRNSFLAPLDKAEVMLSADEDGWQALWKKYYESVNIPARKRLKQMRGYLPVRYRKYMTEF